MEPAQHPRFGDIRSILQGPPTEEGWQQLCALVGSWEDEAIAEVLLPYAQEHLRRWPDALRVAPKRWVGRARAGQKLSAAWALVRHVDLSRMGLWDEDLRRLARAGVLRHARQLQLRFNWIGARGAELLARTTELDELELLDLSDNTLEDEGGVALARATSLPRLTNLSLGSNRLGVASLTALGEAAFTPQLRALTLRNNHLSDAHMRALASAPLVALEHLNMSNNLLGDQGVHALFGRHHALHGLRELELYRNDIGAAGARALAWQAGEAITALSLNSNRLGDEGFRHLMGSANLRHIERLYLSHNELRDESLLALTDTPHMTRLRTLDLKHNQLGRVAMELLCHTSSLRALEALRLSENKIDAAGLGYLMRWPGLTGLRALDLSSNAFRDDGVAALESALPDGESFALERLSLGHNTLGDEAFARLLRAPLLSRVRTLDMQANQLGPRAMQALAGLDADALPQLRELVLPYNPLGDEGARALAHAPCLRRLERLDLNRCSITLDGTRALAASPHLPDTIRALWQR